MEHCKQGLTNLREEEGKFLDMYDTSGNASCVGVSMDRSDGTGSSERPCSATCSDTDIIVYKD